MCPVEEPSVAGQAGVKIQDEGTRDRKKARMRLTKWRLRLTEGKEKDADKSTYWVWFLIFRGFPFKAYGFEKEFQEGKLFLAPMGERVSL